MKWRITEKKKKNKKHLSLESINFKARNNLCPVKIPFWIESGIFWPLTRHIYIVRYANASLLFVLEKWRTPAHFTLGHYIGKSHKTKSPNIKNC